VPRRVLQPQPLSREAFALFGDVIETGGAQHFPINRGSVQRYHDLARVDVGEGGRALVSIFECTRPRSFPIRVDLMERHPLGSQAFVPLDDARMCVVVAPPGDTLEPSGLRAFLSDGRQGVNYHPGTWHMPLVAFAAGRRFLVVDRGGPGENCEERTLGVEEEIVVEQGDAPGAGA